LRGHIKENHTTTSCKLLLQDSWQHQGRSRELLLHDQLMQWQDSANYYCMINSCNCGIHDSINQ
jgi:hypothetical protein